MRRKFKPGDTVECVEGNRFLNRGECYIVRHATQSDCVYLHGDMEVEQQEWASCRFKLVTPAPELETEKDPSGTPQHEPGAKLDKGKPRAAMLLDFGNALTAVAEVATYGAEKYSDGGWLHVPNGEQRYADAGMRHRLADNTEPADLESGLSHLAHAAWNILAELELRIRAQK